MITTMIATMIKTYAAAAADDDDTIAIMTYHKEHKQPEDGEATPSALAKS